MKKKGLFISFEGIDGSGKTTQVKRLGQSLRDKGYELVTVREPGGTPVAEKIRELLLDARNDGICPRTEAFLYAAARAQLVTEVINPALTEGRVVIADRYLDSTLAYQGYGRGLDTRFLEQLNRLAVAGTVPDLTIILDISPVEGMVRRSDSCPDRLEREGLQFQEAVRAGYLSLSRQYPERIKVVDAMQPPEQVYAEIVALVTPFLAQLAEAGV
ncbi:MAG: dTMP kinase [Syntrophomonadaceae bacterium]|nr:dTMP kinase [Syntrophomonadaceae bacterium]